MTEKKQINVSDPFIQNLNRSSHILTPFKVVLLAIVTETADLINEDRPALDEQSEREYLILLCKLIEVIYSYP